jgi:integrase
MGLGSASDVSLAYARIAADEARKHAREGRDPIELRKQQRVAARLAEIPARTFQQCVEGYVAANKGVWLTEKHERHWTAPLKRYAYPVFGALAVSEVEVRHITEVLDPLWTSKTETASRLRGRIENVLDWAAVRGYRTDANPARWKGHLAKVFPAQGRIAPVKHLAALPFVELAAFMATLRLRDGMGALAFEFTILTAARTGETLGARWREIDLRTAIWTVPAERMKAGRPHRVPLSSQALAVLSQLNRGDPDDLVFPGRGKGGSLSSMVFLMTLRRMGRSDLTAHGFRSTFRDWVAEKTEYPNEVAEAALAHVVGDRTEAAYRRGDLFEKRRRLMQDWATYCSAQGVAHEERRTALLEGANREGRREVDHATS